MEIAMKTIIALAKPGTLGPTPCVLEIASTPEAMVEQLSKWTCGVGFGPHTVRKILGAIAESNMEGQDEPELPCVTIGAEVDDPGMPIYFQTIE